MIVYDSLQSLADASAPELPGHVALGLFDGLHPGHQAVISAAVEAAGKNRGTPWVFTFTMGQDHPAGKQAAGRLATATLRNRLLEEMGVTHLLCPSFLEFRDLEPEAYVENILHRLLGARAVFCGENYHFGRRAAGTVRDLRELCSRWGIQVTVLPEVQMGGEPVSSTRIRARIAEGDMESARTLLGRPFTIDFEVIAGRKLGRSLNFPTINQPFPADYTLPRFGVYASVAVIDGERRLSVTNVGVKPTVGSDRVLAETCILGYEGDLYGQCIPVELLAFIRPERKFENVEALRVQIQQDISTAKRMIGGLQL